MTPLEHIAAAEHHLLTAYNILRKQRGGRGELWQARQPDNKDKAHNLLQQISDTEFLIRERLGLLDGPVTRAKGKK